jgi:hypothetical protein
MLLVFLYCYAVDFCKLYAVCALCCCLLCCANLRNILEPTMGVTFFKSGFKTDPIELFPSIVLLIAGEKRFPPPNFNLTPKIPSVFLTNFCNF